MSVGGMSQPKPPGYKSRSVAQSGNVGFGNQKRRRLGIAVGNARSNPTSRRVAGLVVAKRQTPNAGRWRLYSDFRLDRSPSRTLRPRPQSCYPLQSRCESISYRATKITIQSATSRDRIETLDNGGSSRIISIPRPLTSLASRGETPRRT
ncbi:hypothetical protein PGT21_002274 [Puccinia graminis f. sp. tritici]|uniref:Uncharacterized protein n=1 Tax=Puccinia graminis f. sp. tritici TaxID=56615 RepID=A0A5B0PRF3_PUCGR|nr:hypothetical protein PGT21_002274 [Puccinia graminis f. sp. tritici]